MERAITAVQRLGLIVIGLGAVFLIGTGVDIVLAKWRYRWVVGTPTLVVVVIGFSIALGSWRGDDSDIWFVAGLASLGSFALLRAVLGSVRAGQQRPAARSLLSGWPTALSVVYTALLGGWLLIAIDRGSPVFWPTPIGVAFILLIALVAMRFVSLRSERARWLTLPTATGILVTGWLAVSAGGAAWIMLVSTAASLHLVVKGELSQLRGESGANV